MTKSIVSNVDDLHQGTLYAISLESTKESLETAHQKDSLLFRDSLSNNCQQQHSLLLDHNCDGIQSAIPMERQEVGYQQQQRWNQMGQVATNRQGTSTSTVRKTTTAQTFFKTETKRQLHQRKRRLSLHRAQTEEDILWGSIGYY